MAEIAKSNPSLKRFLAQYPADDCFYDWGDDPAFFPARNFVGDVRAATWGVCRRTLRAILKKGDLVIFFCADQRNPPTAEYYFIGFGTVAQVISRRKIWLDQDFYIYQRFFNVLARLEGKCFLQNELFRPVHSDWRRRLPSYVLFEQSKNRTEFNLERPLKVATYDGEPPESWHCHDAIVSNLHCLIIKNRTRTLRTSKTGFAHPHIRLASDKAKTEDIRKGLSEIMAAVRSASKLRSFKSFEQDSPVRRRLARGC